MPPVFLFSVSMQTLAAVLHGAILIHQGGRSFHIGMFLLFNALNPLLKSTTTYGCIQLPETDFFLVPLYVAPSSSSSCSGRLPGHGSMVTATPMPLRPTGMVVTPVHSFLSGQ